jgi:hypothetical protein
MWRHFAECYCAECHFVECHYVIRRDTDFHFDGSHHVLYH